jgi:hypothetical protein
MVNKETKETPEPRAATLEEFVTWYYSEEVAFTDNIRPVVAKWLNDHGYPAPPFPLVQA